MRRYAPLLKLLGVALFIGIIVRLDGEVIGGFLASAQWKLLLYGIAALFGVLCVKAFRWHTLVEAAGAQRSATISFREFMIGVFLSTWTPGKIGDFGKAAYVRSYGIGMKTGAIIVIIERMADAGILLVMALLGAWALYGTRGWEASVVATLALACVICIAARFSQKIAGAIRYCISHHALLRLILTTTLGWGLHYIWVICVARSIGITVSIPVLIAAATGSSLLNALPIAPLGLGTREAALLYLLSPHGVEPERVVALSMLMLLELLIVAVPGAWFWLRHPL